MFCTQCGTQNPEDASNCTTCGNALHSQSQPPKKPDFDPVALVKRFRASKFFLPCVIGGAALILAIILLIALGGGKDDSSSGKKNDSKTKPIEKMLDGMIEYDIEKFLSAFPDEYSQLLDENYIHYYYIDNELFEYYDDLRDDVGDKIKYRYKVADKRKLNDSELDDLKSYYGLPKRDITEAWEMDVDVTFTGSEGDDMQYFVVIVFKYDGKWYVSPTSDIF